MLLWMLFIVSCRLVLARVNQCIIYERVASVHPKIGRGYQNLQKGVVKGHLTKEEQKEN